jgi:hypothetical protein
MKEAVLIERFFFSLFTIHFGLNELTAALGFPLSLEREGDLGGEFINLYKLFINNIVPETSNS